MGGILKSSIVLLLLQSIFTDKGFAGDISPVEIVFKKNEIVPDVLPVAPKCKVWVTYPNGKEVEFGNELTPTQAMDAPDVSWAWEWGNDEYYTLAMVDPDAPSRATPTFRNFEHWLVGNIPGHHVASGDTIAQYYRPTPPAGSDLHRYVFLVYKQPSRLVFYEPRLNNGSTVGRTMFSIAGFARKYKLGDPIVGNFFESQAE